MPDARVRRVGNTRLVARADTIMELNATGALIWRLADGKRSIREISGGVRREYDVAADEAHDETVEFITELIVAGLMMVKK
jgi:hypothetical protein